MLRRYTSRLVLSLKILLFLSIISALVYFLLFSEYFLVKEVEVSGTERFVNADDIRQLAESNSLNTNIFSFKGPEFALKLQDNFLGAKNISIRKAYPNKLKVFVQERIPIAILFNDNGEEHYLVDEDGYVLGFTNPSRSDLPNINYEKEIEVGLFIDKNLVPLYLELTSILEQEQVPVSSISFNTDYVSFYVQNGPKVFLGNEKNKSEYIKAVSALIKQTQLENKEIRRIDLRYDKVIVLFE